MRKRPVFRAVGAAAVAAIAASLAVALLEPLRTESLDGGDGEGAAPAWASEPAER